MHGYESFFISDADGSNKTVIPRSVPPSPAGWQLGTVYSTEVMHGIAEAIANALAQNPAGGRYHSRVYRVHGGPDITFAANAAEDPHDDTITLPGLSAWSRSKAEAFVAAVPIYAPLPPEV